MSVLRATSWGRTRGPKTLVGVQGGEVDVVTDQDSEHSTQDVDEAHRN